MGFIKRKSQLDQAIEQYEGIVSKFPNEARYHLKLGDLYLDKGDEKRGIDHLIRAADCFSESGFYLKSIAIYKKILRMDPIRVDVYFKLGELYQRNGLLGDALVQYRKVVNLYKREGKVDLAIKTLRKMIEVDTSNLEVRLKFAEFLLGEDFKEQALEELLNVASIMNLQGDREGFKAIKEHVLKIYEELSLIYNQQGKDISEAPFYPLLSSLFKEQTTQQVEFERDVEEGSISFEPSEEDDMVLQLLEEARIYVEQGLFDEAEVAYRRILEVDPGNKMVQTKLRSLEETKKEFFSPKSPSEVTKIFRNYKTLAGGEMDISSLAQQIGADILKEKKEGDLKVHYDLAMAYLEIGMFEEAIDEFRIAAGDPKWEFDSYRKMAECYREKGDLNFTIKYLKKALRKKDMPRSEFLEISYELGKAYESKGMSKEALIIFQKIGQVDQNFKDIQERVRALSE